MPQGKYIKVLIDGQQMDLDPGEMPVSISYKLEDPNNFQSKKSAESFNLKFPATVVNDQIVNTFHNPGIDDLTPNETFRSVRNGLIEGNGYELLIGKALLISARYNSQPLNYEFNFYGANADWLIPLKEATVFDFLKQITFPFTKAHMIDSWAFDGTDEDLPYVFAPVRYGQPMDTMNDIPDYNMLVAYMKPALSVYWLIYWGFKSLGYKISSEFFNTNYFRRMVMPWTWGNFLFSEGTRLDNLKFLAKSSTPGRVWNMNYENYLDCHVDNESTLGAHDTNGVYEYDPVEKEMKWNYIPGLPYGPLDATFDISIFVDATAAANSRVQLYLRWFKNSVQFHEDEFVHCVAEAVGREDVADIFLRSQTVRVEPNDIVSVKIWALLVDTGIGRANVLCNIDSFELAFFRIPVGATIDFVTYNSFKKHKFLDFLAGVLDCFNISPQTDTINKIVTMEPMHDYSLVYDQSVKSGGYFNGNHLDWSDKQDVSQISELSLFSESERELLFKFKDDSNDGILKKVQDRNATKLAQGKYVFPDRFKAGVKEHENRFFSPVIHYRVEQWGGLLDGIVPQMICMVPENISNTSRDEAQNTFAPKIAWYKGQQEGMDWLFDSEMRADFPFMFSVNYLSGGADDPILSYCDEYVVHSTDGLRPTAGLLRRFFLQRMAIMRNGQYHDTFFKLNNLDVSNTLHREHIVFRGNKHELVEISDFKPLQEETTKCFLRKWSPITLKDSDNVFPSADSVEGIITSNRFDTKYNNLTCLSTDLR